MWLPILIGSENDKSFLNEGLEYLEDHKIPNKVIVSSVHRNPEQIEQIIKVTLNEGKNRFVICGAATATGLPGVVAGHLRDRDIVVLGVRFTKMPGQNIIEDATFNLSSMPKGVPFAYTGYNEKGFLHACMMAVKYFKK